MYSYIYTNMSTVYMLNMHNFICWKTRFSDPVYTVPDSRGVDIKFSQVAIILTLTTFSMISCYKII